MIRSNIFFRPVTPINKKRLIWILNFKKALHCRGYFHTRVTRFGYYFCHQIILQIWWQKSLHLGHSVWWPSSSLPVNHDNGFSWQPFLGPFYNFSNAPQDPIKEILLNNLLLLGNRLLQVFWELYQQAWILASSIACIRVATLSYQMESPGLDIY